MKFENQSNPIKLATQATLTIGHRPNAKIIRAGNYTHLISLISVREGADNLKESVKRFCPETEYINLPFDNANITLPEFKQRLQLYLPNLLQLANGAQNNIYISCAAGIHRTGTVTYLLLRKLGYTPETAKETIRQLRMVTALNMGEKRFNFIDELLTTNEL